MQSQCWSRSSSQFMVKYQWKCYYFTCFLDFRIGIVAGIVLHIGMLIYNQNSPRILVERPTETDVRITLEHGIAFPVCEVNTHNYWFPVCDYQRCCSRTKIWLIFQDLLDTVNAEIEVEPVPIVVIVDLKNAYTADVAAARTLRKISQKCTEKDIRLKIINVNVSFSFWFFCANPNV